MTDLEYIVANLSDEQIADLDEDNLRYLLSQLEEEK